MKIEYQKIIRDEKTLNPFLKQSEPELKKISTNLREYVNTTSSRNHVGSKYITGYVIKQIYNLEGLAATLINDIRFGLAKEQIYFEKTDSRHLKLSENNPVEIELDINVNFSKNICEGHNSRQNYSFNEDYMLTEQGSKTNNGILGTNLGKKNIPIYKEEPLIYVNGNIFFENIFEKIDVMSIYRVLNDQKYTYNHMTTKDLEKKLLLKMEKSASK